MIVYDLHYGNFLVSPFDQFARLHTRFSAQESTWMLFGNVVSLGWLTEFLTEFIIGTRKGVSISDCVGGYANSIIIIDLAKPQSRAPGSGCSKPD